ncbi:hypothetical protein DFH09DRAFT_1090097 [Mycena vulgaris]|nr:hypothetical protein DFH09DRAFT_1090097 [Mycena vulgaris]
MSERIELFHISDDPFKELISARTHVDDDGAQTVRHKLLRRCTITACPRRAGTTRSTCCTARRAARRAQVGAHRRRARVGVRAEDVFGVERERKERRCTSRLEELEASGNLRNITSFPDPTSLESSDLTAMSDVCGDEMDYSGYWSGDLEQVVCPCGFSPLPPNMSPTATHQLRGILLSELNSPLITQLNSSERRTGCHPSLFLLELPGSLAWIRVGTFRLDEPVGPRKGPSYA